MRRTDRPLPPALLDAAATVVRRRTGLTFAGARVSALESGVVRAMHAAGLSDPAIYLARLDGEIELLDALVGEITVGETYFFRDTAQWDLVRSRLLPPLLGSHTRQSPVRVWSAGCASGEEPYTVAIVLHQVGALGQARILGTDVSRSALAAARRGSYTRWALRGVPDEIVERYFHRTAEQFELASPIREAVELRRLNLAEDSYPNPGAGLAAMDLILCRNVLIYFDLETVTRVAERLLASLADDGWLLLGASDPVLTSLVPCEVEVTDAGLAYRRRQACPSSAPRENSWEPVVAAVSPPESAVLAAESSPAPGSVRDIAAEAARRYAARDYDGVVELVSPLVPRGEDDPALGVVLVRALANRGDVVEAGRVCAAVLERHRGSAELAYLHAVLLLQADRHVDAAAAARRALYLDRDLVVAHLALGGALARIGDIEGARRAVRNAQRLLAAMAPDIIVPGSDGEPAGHLAELARAQLQGLQGAAG